MRAFLLLPGKCKAAWKDQSGSTSDALFVSLYLVVLAFFIVINSVASIELEKYREVMGSVKDTFSIPKIPKLNQPPQEIPTMTYGSQVTYTTMWKDVAKLARESVSLIDAKVVELDEQMQITIPAESFFFKDQADIQISQDQFLGALAKELLELETDHNIEVEVTISPEKSEGIMEQQDMSLRRVIAVARILEDRGADKERIYIGIDPTLKPSELRLGLYERFTPNSAVTVKERSKAE